MTFVSKNSLLFPKLLKEISDKVKGFYYEGDLKALNNTLIAIVGTRKCTAYGIGVTKKIVKELSKFKVTIVSGLANGIDSVAHQSALEFGLPTIAVLGTPLNKIYPASNRLLAKEIVNEKGMLISEHEENKATQKFHFVARNRIISGLSLATIIIEAPAKSGALQTARFAFEQNRLVFTVPANIDKKESSGCLKLMQENIAYPISSGDEVIENIKVNHPGLISSKETSEINSNLIAQKYQELSKNQRMIIEIIKQNTSATMLDLMDNLKLPLRKILIELSNLELLNLIQEKYSEYYLVS